jgi:alanine dehydrogenase
MSQYGKAGWDAVQPLSKRIASGKRREASDDISLFKAMGMGISDLALGTELAKRALERGVGRVIPQPKKTKARLAAGKTKAAV